MSRRVERHRDVVGTSSHGPEADQDPNAKSSEETDRLLAERRADGWQLIAMEWRREAPATEGEFSTLVEVPYGLKVAEDSVHLTTAVEEHEAMVLMLDLLVTDKPMKEVAEELNKRGFVTRDGHPFTQVVIFELVPRLVEIAPEVFSTSTWKDLRIIRKQIQAMA